MSKCRCNGARRYLLLTSADTFAQLVSYLYIRAPEKSLSHKCNSTFEGEGLRVSLPGDAECRHEILHSLLLLSGARGETEIGSVCQYFSRCQGGHKNVI